MMNLDKAAVAMNRLSESQRDRFWPAVFLEGCNLRCQYCLNTSIVDRTCSDGCQCYISISSILEQLDLWGEDGVIISGGEPLLPRPDSNIIDFIKVLSAGGRKIGIATNGTYPKELKFLLVPHQLISFISLDCKFSPLVRGEDIVKKTTPLCGYVGMEKDILKSIATVNEWHHNDVNAQSEVKLTLFPPVVQESDVTDIAQLVHPNSKLILQQYRQNIMFNGKENEVEPYSADEIERLKDLAVKLCKAKVEVRWP